VLCHRDVSSAAVYLATQRQRETGVQQVKVEVDTFKPQLRSFPIVILQPDCNEIACGQKVSLSPCFLFHLGYPFVGLVVHPPSWSSTLCCFLYSLTSPVLPGLSSQTAGHLQLNSRAAHRHFNDSISLIGWKASPSPSSTALYSSIANFTSMSTSSSSPSRSLFGPTLCLVHRRCTWLSFASAIGTLATPAGQPGRWE